MYIKYDKRGRIPYFGVARFAKEHPGLKLKSKDGSTRAVFEGKWQGREAIVNLDGATTYITYKENPTDEQKPKRKRRRSKVVPKGEQPDQDDATTGTGPVSPPEAVSNSG